MRSMLRQFRRAPGRIIASVFALALAVGAIGVLAIPGAIAHWALGHVDMLRHLCHHTFEPTAEVKLGSVVDLISYAEAFREEIDWNRLRDACRRPVTRSANRVRSSNGSSIQSVRIQSPK